MAGVSCEAEVSYYDDSYRGGVLFTHRGLSGPAILKISSHWDYGDAIQINFVPDLDFSDALEMARRDMGSKQLKSWLHTQLAKPIVQWLLEQETSDLGTKKLAELKQTEIDALEALLTAWTWTPADTEGYRTAEVTQGGIDVSDISSKTMESKLAKDLYFIGEVLDVTGQLGGFNFQWAWSSAYVAAQSFR